MSRKTTRLRQLVLVLGDQLDPDSAAFDGFDAAEDAVLLMEVGEEASYIRQHKARLAYFFACMRHFRDAQRAAGRAVHYVELDDPANTGSFAGEVRRWADALRPERIVVLQPGDWRVRETLAGLGRPILFREDRHFLCPTEAFETFLNTHQGVVQETFYRFMRQRLGVLMEPDGGPTGGAWNFDRDNRRSFDRETPPIPRPPRFAPDATTQAVITMVERTFPDSPGRIGAFGLPVTPEQARAALDDFVENRLGRFGTYQDAMLGGEWLLYHSHLSGPMNLHLLQPRQVVDAVIRNPADAPLNAVEGYVRQVIGWREFVRGIYWRFMPDYADRNALGAELPVPHFYWTGETDMRCLAEAIGHTIEHAYAHHIERLMVLGLFCLLLGVRPYEVHRWHVAMFWDAVDWVSLPNTLGMSQHGDGGVIGTKPYAASGSYINRMSDHCRHCRYDPRQATGERACPFTTLYWDFLARHRTRFGKSRRMRMQYVNLDRKDRHERELIGRQADGIRARLA